jgi:hypothetical protein
MSLNFTVIVKNNSGGPISFGFVINPKNFVQGQFTIYKDYFPVFWHVAKWNQDSVRNINADDPIEFSYKENIYAYLSEKEISSQITIGGYHTDDPVNGYEYQITGKSQSDQQIIEKGSQSQYTYEVINNSNYDANTGLSTLVNGEYNNYLACDLKSKFTLTVVQSVELAFFSMPEVIQDTPVMQAEINAPWWTVNSKDIQNNTLTITINSTTNVETDAKITTPHSSDEPLFQ